MGLTRRQAVLTGLSTLVLGGCAHSSRVSTRVRPAAPWPGYPAGPTPSGYRYTPVEPAYPPVTVTQQAPATAAVGGINAIARSSWTSTNPVRSKVNPMGGVSKITIHHEGWTAVNFTDQQTTAQRIEAIRTAHVRDRGWGDIGYHYIVDRAGRVWEGRPIEYQGAHVSENNEHNVGILTLGNFDKQSPSNTQLSALFDTVAQLKRTNNVRTAMVRSHQEIRATECPGANLQRQMGALRSRLG